MEEHGFRTMSTKGRHFASFSLACWPVIEGDLVKLFRRPGATLGDSDMSQIPALESLAQLRDEIDRIDGDMHSLLMERGISSTG